MANRNHLDAAVIGKLVVFLQQYKFIDGIITLNFIPFKEEKAGFMNLISIDKTRKMFLLYLFKLKEKIFSANNSALLVIIVSLFLYS